MSAAVVVAVEGVLGAELVEGEIRASNRVCQYYGDIVYSSFRARK